MNGIITKEAHAVIMAHQAKLAPPSLTIAIIGCGYWGPNLLRNFRALGHKIIAIDGVPARLAHMKSLYPEIDTAAAFDATTACDAVAIATSVRSHFPLAKAALELGKHVFIEKPMAASVAECAELIALAKAKALTLMVGHTFLYSPVIRKIREIVDAGDIGEIRYISARRLNLGLFQKDINVAWDLAPHDISIILHVMGCAPLSVNCTGSAHVTPGIEDVTSMTLNFPNNRSAIIHSSWLDPRKVREMTIVGSKRMIVYDDLAPQEKVRIFDMRVDRPPHYDTFAEFHYAYHYGDTYAPFIKQDEPLRTECAHFAECIKAGAVPLTSGERGMEVVRILEAANESLRRAGAEVGL